MNKIIVSLKNNLNQTPIGTLAQKDNKIYFEYNKEFLKSGIEISPYKLPLKAGLFRCDDDTFEEIILDDLAQSSEAILEGSSEVMLDELLALGGSSAGARPKVLVQLSDDKKKIIHGRQKLKKGFAYYMVKFSNSLDSKESGAIEYAYSLMAKEAGVQMPPTALIEGKYGRYFAIERFDRVGDERVHMHSIAGLVHADFRFPTLDYDDLMMLIYGKK